MQGRYTHRFEGWASGVTRWLVVNPDAVIPDGSQARIRYRNAASEGALDDAEWSPWAGPFAPAALPWNFPEDATGRWLELRIVMQAGPDSAPTLMHVNVMTARTAY